VEAIAKKELQGGELLDVGEVPVGVEEFALAFDREYPCLHLCKDAGLIGTAGADLEYFLKGLYFEQFGLAGNSVGLGDGLTFSDREGTVFIGYPIKHGV